MMTVKTFAAATLLALGSSAFAQTYVGIAAGSTHSCVPVDMTGNCPSNAVSVKAIAGYGFTGTDLAIEGIYDRLGTFSRNGADFKAQTFGVGGAWRPQFDATWGGVVRAGIDYGQTRQWSHTSGSWQPYLGAGLTYAITPRVSLEGDLDFNHLRPGSTGGAESAVSWTGGLNFKF